MSLKMKLTSVIIAIALVLSILIIGVLSVKKVDFKLGGKITFNSEGLELTISDGQLDDASKTNGVYKGSDINEKMKGLDITTATPKQTIESTLGTWNGLDFEFTETSPTAEITFTIKNNNDYMIRVKPTITKDGTNADNVNITKTGDEYLDANSEAKPYSIKFEIKDKELTTNLTSYEIKFDIEKYTPETLTTTNTYSNMAFALNDELKEATVSNYTGTDAHVEVPAYVQPENSTNVYKVTSIKDGQYQGWGYTSVFGGKSYSDRNTTLTSIVLPSTMNKIGISTFQGCSSLTSIDMPNVTTIGNSAFSGCSSLTTIEIPSSVQTIGDGAFYGCSSLTTMEIPSSVQTIGGQTFYGCSSLTTIEIPSSVQTIGNNAFYGCSSLTTIEIPSSVQTIGNNAFSECSSLTTIDIPSSVNTIDNNAFANCISLASINLPNVQTIGNYAFSGCSSLTSINLPNVQTIGNNAFANCSSLTTIEIPSSVQTIDERIFEGCSGLTSVTLNEGLQTISGNAFKDCSSLTSLNIPSSVQTITVSALSGCSGLESITVDERNANYSNAGNALLNKDGTTLIIGCKNTVIPETVRTIEYQAFIGCSSLTTIEIPSNVQTIDERTFEGCSNLKTIILSEGLRSIGLGAFYNCSSLESIKIPSSVNSMTWFGGGPGTFQGCTSLKTVIIDSETIAKDSGMPNGMLANADVCYILSTIESADSISITGFTAQGNGTGEYSNYIKYVKNI